MTDLKRHIRDIPDFPKPGIVFKDITPLLADRVAFRATVAQFADRYRGRVDVVLGIESRGFIIGSAVAYALGTGLALVRKPGKLPAQTHAARYELEYGSDTLEIHHDAFAGHHRVLVIFLSALIQPSPSSIKRRPKAATRSSCDTCTIVVPLSFKPFSSFMISSP